MTGPIHDKLPTQVQINDQFTASKIHQSLAFYNKIKKANGDYQFGDLTVQWYGPNAAWMAQLGTYYDATAQQQIEKYIIEFLTAQPKPIPFTINWGPETAPLKSITKTSNSIEIVGYKAPP
jgi:hypothetical protein